MAHGKLTCSDEAQKAVYWGMATATKERQVDLDPYHIETDAQGMAHWTFRCHDGQWEALQATERFILILAGTQSGKTIFAPWWLLREIMMRGPGDYLFITPTFKLLEKKALPEFLRLFDTRLKYGSYKTQSMKFEFNARGLQECFGMTLGARKGQTEGVTIHFGHAANPDSLESATAKGAVLDECGQKGFKMESWEAIRRRLSIHTGRVLMCTTPYYIGWLKKIIYDRRHIDDDIRVIQFKSTMNPGFPMAEYEAVMESGIPEWRRRMMYDGEFTHPAGRIYECFDEEAHTMQRKHIPKHWTRYMGVDFGGANQAAVYLAAEQTKGGDETGRFYVYRTYHAGSKTIAEHMRHMLSAPADPERRYETNGLGPDAIQEEPRTPRAWGGAVGEGQWRREFTREGLRIVRLRMTDVETQIQRVYAMINTGRLLFFDDLTHIIDDMQSYARVLDDEGRPTEKIDNKEAYHLLDALRYACTGLTRTSRHEVRMIEASM